MRIGIDISQIVYEGTGVGRYVREMVRSLVEIDPTNEYILFGSSFRRRDKFYTYYHDIIKNKKNVLLKVWWLPPTLLDILWNQIHIIPIEWLIGNIDVFWSSDWVQPPLKQAKGITTIHDLIALTYPEETHPRTEFSLDTLHISSNIVEVQKRRLAWVKKECDVILCDSEATKKDVKKLLGIDEKRLCVVYPGFTI